MNKIIKWIMWALMIVGVVLTIFVFTNDGSDSSVNSLLYWTYAMLGIAVVAIIYGIARDSVVAPKNLLKIVFVLVGAVVLVGVAYLLAPGTPAVGYVGEAVSDGTLKLTDTILNLTYFALGVSIVAILASVVVDSIKK